MVCESYLNKSVVLKKKSSSLVERRQLMDTLELKKYRTDHLSPSSISAFKPPGSVSFESMAHIKIFRK